MREGSQEIVVGVSRCFLVLVLLLALAVRRAESAEIGNQPVLFGSYSFDVFTSADQNWGSPLYSNPALLALARGSRTRYLVLGMALSDRSSDLYKYLRNNRGAIVAKLDNRKSEPPGDDGSYAHRRIQSRYDFTLFEYVRPGQALALRYDEITALNYNGISDPNMMDYQTAGKLAISFAYGSKFDIQQRFLASCYYGTTVHMGASFATDRSVNSGADFDRYFYKYAFGEIHGKLRYQPGLTTDAAIGILYRLTNLTANTTLIVKNIARIGNFTEMPINAKIHNDAYYPIRFLNRNARIFGGLAIPITTKNGDPNRRVNIAMGLTGQHVSLIAGYQASWLFGMGISVKSLELNLLLGSFGGYWGTRTETQKGIKIGIGWTS